MKNDIFSSMRRQALLILKVQQYINGYWILTNKSLGSVILKNTVSLYDEGSCSRKVSASLF